MPSEDRGHQNFTLTVGDRRKWIGLATVLPTPGSTLIDRPAYVNVVGLAEGREEFIGLVASECTIAGLQLAEVEDVEDWATRLQHDEPNCAVRSMADELCGNILFRFGTFYCFQDEE